MARLKKTEISEKDLRGFRLLGHFQNGVPQSAIGLHVSCDLIMGVPCKAVVAKGKVGEQKIWQTQRKQGMGELGKRNYSLDYKLLDRLDEAGGFFPGAPAREVLQL